MNSVQGRGLYFYEMSYSGNKIETGEAEVIEKPKTYSPVNLFELNETLGVCIL